MTLLPPADVEPPDGMGRSFARSGLVVLLVAVALTAGAIGLVGATGGRRKVVDLLPGGAWLASSSGRAVTHVGRTGADATVPVTAGGGGVVDVVQDGAGAYVVDGAGTAYRIDPARLQVVQTADLGEPGSELVLGGGHLFAVHRSTGVVEALDPVTLRSQGRVPVVPGGGPVSAAVVDPSGTLWLAGREGAARGVVYRVDGDRTTVVRRIDGAGDLRLSVAGSTVAAADPASATLVTLRGPGTGRVLRTGLATGAGLLLPARVDEGTVVPVLQGSTAALCLCDLQGSARLVDLGVPTHDLATPQITPGRVYTPDFTTGDLLIVDSATARVLPPLHFTDPGRPFDVLVRDGWIFVNDDATNRAVTIDDRGRRSSIDTDDAPVSPPTTVPRPTTTVTTTPPAPPAPTTDDVPTAPGPVRVDPRDGEALVSWGAATSGSQRITSYTVATAGTAPQTVFAPTTSAVLAGLRNGDTYTFEVRATNAAGVTGPATRSAPTVLACRTGTPTEVRATLVAAGGGATRTAAPGTAAVAWRPPACSGDSPVTSYRVTASADGPEARTVPASATATELAGLVPGQRYTFSVVAVDAAGGTSAPAPSNVVLVPGPPGAPTGLTALASTVPGSVTLAWRAPADGGSPITGYAVTYGTGTPLDRRATSVTSSVVVEVDRSAATTFAVRALSALGQGAPSAAVTYTPGSPTTSTTTGPPSTTQPSTSQPPTTRRSPGTGPTLTAPPTTPTTAPPTTAPPTTTPPTTAPPTTTPPSTTPPTTSPPTTAPPTTTPAATVPAAPPVQGTPRRISNGIRVTWQAPADGGSPITGYTVSLSDGEQVDVAADATLSWTFNDLEPDTTYTASVVARNAVGTGTAGTVDVTTAPDAGTCSANGTQGVARADAAVWGVPMLPPPCP